MSSGTGIAPGTYTGHMYLDPGDLPDEIPMQMQVDPNGDPSSVTVTDTQSDGSKLSLKINLKGATIAHESPPHQKNLILTTPRNDISVMLAPYPDGSGYDVNITFGEFNGAPLKITGIVAAPASAKIAKSQSAEIAAASSVVPATASSVTGIYTGTFEGQVGIFGSAAMTISLAQSSSGSVSADVMLNTADENFDFQFPATAPTASSLSASPETLQGMASFGASISQGSINGALTYAPAGKPVERTLFTAKATTGVAGNVSLTKSGAELSGVTITLQRLKGGKKHGKAVTTTTDALGNYSFTGVAAGTYSISQTVPKGDVAYSPKSAYTVSIVAGQSLVGENFVDKK